MIQIYWIHVGNIFVWIRYGILSPPPNPLLTPLEQMIPRRSADSCGCHFIDSPSVSHIYGASSANCLRAVRQPNRPTADGRYLTASLCHLCRRSSFSCAPKCVKELRVTGHLQSCARMHNTNTKIQAPKLGYLCATTTTSNVASEERERHVIW